MERLGPGGVGHIIQIAVGVCVFEVDGRRNVAVLHRQEADGGFDGARSAERVAVHRLGGADGNVFRRFPRAVLMASVSVLSLCGVELP